MCMKRHCRQQKKISKNRENPAGQNDIWEKYVQRLLISKIFRHRTGQNSDKESSHVVGIIHNNTLARTCRLLRFGGEPP